MKHFKTTWQHIRRTPYQALVAIFVITLTFYLASVFAVVVSGSQTLLHFFETRPQISAFFKDDVELKEIEVLKTKLSATGKIAQIKYVSKEEALAIYREQNKNDPLLLEMVTANILPASLEISTTDLSALKEIAQILREANVVEEVVFQEDVVKKLESWTIFIRRAGIELVGSLALISFLILPLIIGMKVILRREEIQVLQLIGASSWYIRAPFVLEGAFYGIVGVLLGWGVAYLRLLFLAPSLVEFLADTPIPPVPPLNLMAILLGIEVLLGTIIGVLGSLLAVRRYLR